MFLLSIESSYQAAATLEQQQQQQQPQQPPALPLRAASSPAPEAGVPEQAPPQPPPAQAAGPGEGSVEKTLMQQLYGMNHGISSFPSGVATANPFLHPAMFSATGRKSECHQVDVFHIKIRNS